MNKTSKKVATDLYVAQMKWVAWFLPIVYIAYFALILFLNEPDISIMSLLTLTFQSTTIFMLVTGILSTIIFLPIFIKNGVSRKAYFQGALFAAFGLASTIIGISAILTWIISLADMDAFSKVELSPLGGNSWLATIAAYFVTVMIYFGVGWLIGTAFYRAGASKGIIAIATSLFIVTGNDLLWIFSTPKPFIGLLDINIPTPPIPIAIIGSITLAIITVIFVQKLVKDIPIKVA